MPTPKMPVYQLKIVLSDIRPQIWRRVQVPAGISLDELHLVMAPVFVGEGERLLGGMEGYEVAGFEASEAAVHYRIAKKGRG